MRPSDTTLATGPRTTTRRFIKPLWLFGCLVLVAGLMLARTGVWLDQPIDTTKAMPDGHAYTIGLRAPRLFGVRAPYDALVSSGDTAETPERASTRVYEDGRAMGPPHSLHADIRALGGGRFSHWEKTAGQQMLLFSSRDASDPRNNGRHYVARIHYMVGDAWSRWLTRLLYLLGIGLIAGWIAILWLSSISMRGLALLATGIAITAAAAAHTSHGLFLASAITCIALATVLASSMLSGLISKQWHDGVMRLSGSFVLVVASIGSTLVLIETGLWFASLRPDLFAATAPAAAIGRPDPLMLLSDEAREIVTQRAGHLTMPATWEHRDVVVAGAHHAFFWHGVLHLLDEDGFRRARPLPQRPHPDRYRIMVIGDSLTYGYGIDAHWGYPQVLERKLAATVPVEMINLGVGGHQSEDVLRVLRSQYDALDPDLIIYGICLNDFLDSGQEQFNRAQGLIPEFMQQRTRLGRWLQDLVPATARTLGIAVDFYDEILINVDHYQARFARDLQAMSDLVASRGGRPIVAMVLNQFPGIDPRSERLTQMAEAAARAAGMDVIVTDTYTKTWRGFDFRVSRWEGHPNEIANELFADMLDQHIAGCCGMDSDALEAKPVATSIH